MTPKSSFRRVGPIRRSLAFLYALIMCGMLGASCSNLLGLDDHASAVNELCELIDRCYGPDMLADCDARLGDHLMAASSESREGWLRDFGEASCLESCTNAWLCLDTTPVCGGIGDTCTTPSGCCGFTDNVTDCSAAGSCCTNKGHACEDSADCCSGECRNGLCGGQQCLPTGEPCVFGSECCSNDCDAIDKRCDESCLPGGAECTSADDCCSRECFTSGMGEGPGFCGQPQCEQELATCDPDGLECCDGGQCVFIPIYGGFVCTSGCWPQGSACTAGVAESCCSGQCDVSTGACTMPDRSDAGSSSSSGTGGGATMCMPFGEPCNSGPECCAQQCYNGFCCQAQGMGGSGGSGGMGGAGGSGAGGSGGSGLGGAGGSGGSGLGGASSTSSSSTSSTSSTSSGSSSTSSGSGGAPAGCLEDLCDANQPPSAIDCQCTDPSCTNAGCIAQICAADPFCCCVAWDQLCVNAATQYCGLNCPMMTGTQRQK